MPHSRQMAPDGRHFAMGLNWPPVTEIWDLSTLLAVRILDGHWQDPTSASFSPGWRADPDGVERDAGPPLGHPPGAAGPERPLPSPSGDGSRLCRTSLSPITS